MLFWNLLIVTDGSGNLIEDAVKHICIPSSDTLYPSIEVVNPLAPAGLRRLNPPMPICPCEDKQVINSSIHVIVFADNGEAMDCSCIHITLL
jgi:hypothetical protein